MNGQSEEKIDFTFDRKNLCREESITDLKVGAIRRLIPITPQGDRDQSRQVIYIGHAQLRSPKGLVPLQVPLTATTLEQAIEEFPGAMQKAFDEMVKMAQQSQGGQPPAQDQTGSRIITPGR